jgi:sugar (pentulose or hexulose) kinase
MIGVYLGLDIGTSSVKAVLVDAAGSVVAIASRALDVSYPHPLWSEQDPDSWVDATIGAVDELASTHPAAVAAVRGVGLSGQMHGATLLDAEADNDPGSKTYQSRLSRAMKRHSTSNQPPKWAQHGGIP